MEPAPDTSDSRVRLFVYRHLVTREHAPSKAEVAAGLDVPTEEVAEAFERLAAARALVLQPESGEVLMAEPFSAVPTPFRVTTARGAWWGNCIWDALGIPGMLGEDARIETGCGDCHESMVLEVRDGALEPAAGVVHFLLPARRWWEDVVFT